MIAGLPDGLFKQIAGGFDVMFELTDPVDYELDADWSFGARARAARRRPGRDGLRRAARARRHQLLYLPLFNFAHGTFDDIHEMISTPFSLFGLSDAGAHCGAICDASMTTSSLVGVGPRPQARATGSRSSRSCTSRPSAPRSTSAGSTAASSRPATSPTST